MVITARNFLIMPKKSATDALKTSSKRVIQKAVEATGDLLGNKIANKMTNLSKNSQQDNSETVTNEHYKEIPPKIYISRKNTGNYWWTKIKMKLI